MTMEELIKDQNFVPFFQPLGINDIVKGKVIGRGRLALFIDLGIFGTGIVYGRELFKARKILGKLNKGDEVTAKILKMDGEQGYTEISITKAKEEMAWRKLRELKEKREPLIVKASKANKGGLMVNIEGISGFLPVSHLKPEHYPKVEDSNTERILQKLQDLIGKELKVVVLSAEPESETLILSEKEANTEKMKKIIGKYGVGDNVQGIITGVVDFGAFIKFPYPAENENETLEGLIHISELDWQLIEDPHNVVNEGDIIKAQIIDITNSRISLSLKSLKKDPWKELGYEKGNMVKGKVIKFNPFGAFVQIKPRVQGLIHISEFGNEEKMKEKIEIGKNYNFEISAIDPDEHRMILKLSENEN